MSPGQALETQSRQSALVASQGRNWLKGFLFFIDFNSPAELGRQPLAFLGYPQERQRNQGEMPGPA